MNYVSMQGDLPEAVPLRGADVHNIDAHNPEEETGGLISSREQRLREARRMNLLSDAFMSVALNDIPACQHVLRILMNRPKLVVKEVRTQYRVSKIASHDAVLDVLAEDEDGVLYSVEIQRPKTLDHARRTRFYGAMIDSEFLVKGAGYERMPETYIIYVSEKDIWHMGAAVYHVKKLLSVDEPGREQEWSEWSGIPYDDGIHVIYVNAAVDDGSETAKLMRYFRTADPGDMSQGELSRRIHFLKEEEGGEEIMCEISEKWWREGCREGEESKAYQISLNLFRMGMPVEKIAEAVQMNVAVVRQWLGAVAAQQ